MAKFEFAIKKDTLNSGKVVFTPVCRKKSKFKTILLNPWERITKVYNEYMLMTLDFEPGLSYQECEEHIHGYQEKLLKSVENEVAMVEFDTLEIKSY